MSTRIFVGNLNFQTTEQQLRDLFGADGREIVDARIITDRETGRSRGFAFVEFANDADARSAIETFDGQDLDGRPLRVNEANERPQRGGGGGGGGGGGYGGGGGGRGGRGGGGGGRRY